MSSQSYEVLFMIKPFFVIITANIWLLKYNRLFIYNSIPEAKLHSSALKLIG